LDVVAAPEGECQMWSGDYQPSRCENDADYLFVYQGSTIPEKDIRRNSLACEECFSPPDEYEDVDSGHGVATDGGEDLPSDETCPQCGREYLRRDTGDVTFGDAPEDARDFCNTAEWSSDGFAVYWHSDEQLSQPIPADFQQE
jgi:hypothetical protein